MYLQHILFEGIVLLEASIAYWTRACRSNLLIRLRIPSKLKILKVDLIWPTDKIGKIAEKYWENLIYRR